MQTVKYMISAVVTAGAAAIVLWPGGSGCLSDNTVVCGSGRCPTDTLCFTPAQTGGEFACVALGCGDDIVGARERCDDGNNTSGDGCSADCQSDESCGNSIVDVGESCDDGNTSSSDGCSADCQSNESCGNGVLDVGEGCDDGNTLSGDGCSADCVSVEICGNGHFDPGIDIDPNPDIELTEECDCGETLDDVPLGTGCAGQPNSDNGGLCDSQCQFHCGNGRLADDEFCDGFQFSNNLSCLTFGNDYGHIQCNSTCSGYQLNDCGGFLRFESMNSPTSERLHGISGSGPNDVYAVGENGTVLHYDGTNWTLLTDIPTNENLRAVWAHAANDVAIVGDNGVELHFDGTSWTQSEATSDNDLYAVWSDGSTRFAVGSNSLVRRVSDAGDAEWNVAYYSSSCYAAELYAVWGFPGDFPTIELFGSYGLRYAVGGVFSLPQPEFVFCNELSRGDIYAAWAFNKTRTFIVGASGLILATDGSSTFEPFTVPTDNTLRGVWGSAPEDVYAVGDSGVVLHFDGSSWKFEFLVATNENLRAVWGSSAEDVFVVGDRGTILHSGGFDRRIGALGDGYLAQSIHGLSSSEVYAVATRRITPERPEHESTVMHYDGITWTQRYSTADIRIFSAIWANASDQIYVARSIKDDDGLGNSTMMYYDGDDWARIDWSRSNVLHGMWGDGDSTVYAVGSGGIIVRCTLDTCSEDIQSPTDARLYDIWGGANGDTMYAVGDEATVLRYQGGAWQQVTALPTEIDANISLRGVWGASDDSVYVVGDNGTVIYYDGATWTLQQVGDIDLENVWGRSGDDVFVVGASDQIWHYDGASWAPINTGQFSDLADVWVPADADDIFSASRGNELLHLKIPRRP